MAAGHRIALIRGDGIGQDVSDAAVTVVNTAIQKIGMSPLHYQEITAGTGY